MRKIITEETIKEAGFTRMSTGVYLKKGLVRNEIWVRCNYCGRWNPESIKVSKATKSVVVQCPYDTDSDGRKIITTTYAINTQKLKIVRQKKISKVENGEE